jgi:hypothetical protein
MAVSFKCEILSGDQEKADAPVDAVVKINKKGARIEYAREASNFYIFLCLIFLGAILLFGEKPVFELPAIGVYLMALIAGLIVYVIFISIITTILPPLKKIFYTQKVIDLKRDVMYATYEVTESEVTSLAKTAARLSSVAMAGVLENQGKTSGSYLHLGIAAMMNSNKKKKSHVVYLMRANGKLDMVLCKEKQVKHILNNATNLPKRLWGEYMSLISQLHKNPDLVEKEVVENVERIKVEFANLDEIAKNDPKSEKREAAESQISELDNDFKMYELVLERMV